MRVERTRSILVVTELYGAAEAAIRAAAQLAERTGARLHLAYAAEQPAGGLFPASQRGRRDAEQRLREQMGRVIPPGVVVESCRIVAQEPAEAVLERGAEVGAELLVLGTRRPQRLEHWRGTVLERVLGGAKVPCLLVRGPLLLPLRRVVVPFDLAALAEPEHAMLEVAMEWLRAFGAPDADTGLPGRELRIVHVVPEPFAGMGLPAGRAVVGPVLPEEVGQAVEAEEAAAELLVTEEILWGSSPAEEILRYADEAAAGLLVMAAQSRTGVRRAQLGSVAAAVARRAGCPVLLVPSAVAARAGAAARGVEAVVRG